MYVVDLMENPEVVLAEEGEQGRAAGIVGV
jgi:hypothetical protein